MLQFVSLLGVALLYIGLLPATVNAQRATPQLPDGVKRIADIPYAATDNPRQTLDLVLPTEPLEERLPVIVFIHGGAWRAGHKSAALPRIARFAATGRYAGVSVGYRLSAEAKWPAQIHDCKAAIRWLDTHGADYGMDSTRIGVWGTSAGGHLVAMLGTSGDVPEMEGQIGSNAKASSRVHCVVDFFGPTNFLRMNEAAVAEATLDHNAANSPESQLIGGPILDNPQKVATADPISYVSPDDAPFLIVHGTADRSVPYNQSQLLHAALFRAGVETVLVTVDGGGHGRGFGPDVNQLVRRFFDHHLRGETTEWKDLTLEAVNRD